MQEVKSTIDSLLEEHEETLKGLWDKTPDIARLRDVLVDLVKRDGLLMLCGNGGSAADAIHWAAEWRARFKHDRRALRAEALTTDVSTMTAIGNDFGFEKLFSRQIEAVGRKGDVLIVISTSGNSPNIVRAVEVAKELGILTVGFGGKGGGEMGKLVDIPYVIDSSVTARIQEMHELTMHVLCELVDQWLEDGE